jgi:hypothetical protein
MNSTAMDGTREEDFRSDLGFKIIHSWRKEELKIISE